MNQTSAGFNAALVRRAPGNGFVPKALGAFVCAGLLFARGGYAAEPWSDDRLPVKDGLALWFDCSRQNAGRGRLQLPPLGSGNPVDYLMDGSGHGRHLSQQSREARPRFRQEFNGAFLYFDGQKSAMIASTSHADAQDATVFLVAAPLSNAGNFRGFFGLSQSGANDYSTGMNLDLGPGASSEVSYLNAEGSGFSGGAQLLPASAKPFGGWHIFTLQAQPGFRSVRLFLDGRSQGDRDRGASRIHFDEFVLGARHYSNETEPPFVQGFFHGEIAEFLLYNRALTEPERASVESYLNKKYGLLLNRAPEISGEAKPLVTITNPPPVQMFVPGFTVRELPVSLPNINNVKYRPDGKLVALGYNGQIYLLSDTDGDGLEDRVTHFWTNNTLRAPIGMALTPPGYTRGQGVFVAAKGKLSLIVDTNGDDLADTEIVVAEGWKELSHGVDALGVALDHEGNIYFGLGTSSFTEPYLVDKTTGQSRYDLKSERGTILKVSPDFSRREIVCTGIRFSVALAFNREGDLFCTDQEGATWLPNGNPFDELLHIQPGRHYGFPPRHPKYLPRVIDEPSVFDYAPQHQSACGLNFNEPVNGGPVFGPSWWAGDALVCGYSRGKIWRTKLVKSDGGYVAQNQAIASLPVLTVDACVSPRGDLVVATHGGEPDWGSGPNGAGHLYKISYTGREEPQPVLAWSASPTEIRVAFDRALDPAALKNITQRVEITQGTFVSAGDRFEVKRPGYAAVFSQLGEPRYPVPVLEASLTPDLKTLIFRTKPRQAAVNYGITLAGFKRPAPSGSETIPQNPDVDIVTDLTGVAAEWQPKKPTRSSEAGRASWEGWLPHVDLDVAQRLTFGSADHNLLWPKLKQPGTLTLRGSLNLWEMLQPAIQPGSKLDYERPIEEVSVVFAAAVPFQLKTNGVGMESTLFPDGEHRATLKHRGNFGDWVPFQISLSTGDGKIGLKAAWSAAEDARPRAFPLRRFLVPWARPNAEPSSSTNEISRPEITGGNWLRGKRIFFGETVACSKCHAIRGEGHRVGPDLSNLIQRDYASVLKDIKEPSAALNPDHLAYNIQLSNGEEVTAVLQTETKDEITVADASGKTMTIPRSRVKSILSSPVSLMPEGLVQTLTSAQLKDLMTFLLTSPLEPAQIEAQGQPPPRKRSELDAVLPSPGDLKTAPNSVPVPFDILLCAGPKDHGPGEHDYPLWQRRWARLLALGEGVNVSTAWAWPSAEQWRAAKVVVFYSDNPGWNASRADELEAFLARGGGAVFIHFAVDGHQDVEALARSIGLAWRGGFSKFRHGALDLKLEPSPLTAGIGQGRFADESYWNLVGSLEGSQILASNMEEGELRPLIWTRSRGPGRVFVSIPGHYSWTFDDPWFRMLLLRGICWSGHEPLDRLSELAVIGARVEE